MVVTFVPAVIVVVMVRHDGTGGNDKAMNVLRVGVPVRRGSLNSYHHLVEFFPRLLAGQGGVLRTRTARSQRRSHPLCTPHKVGSSSPQPPEYPLPKLQHDARRLRPNDNVDTGSSQRHPTGSGSIHPLPVTQPVRYCPFLSRHPSTTSRAHVEGFRSRKLG